MPDKKKLLEDLKKNLEFKVGKLPFLKTSEDVIFGEGNAEAEIMFIGEAGGYWEAKLRRPFVGNAGKLLDQLINSIGLKREDVYISNVVKARPPDNRDPLPEEIEAFRPYLDKEIEIIQPKVIVTLGRFSMAKFLPYAKISKDHGVGKMVELNNKKIIVIPMYHPAAALRAGAVDEQLRQDFRKIPAEIERLNKILDGVMDVKGAVEEKKEEQLTLV